jgi:hypothetical protein
MRYYFWVAIRMSVQSWIPNHSGKICEFKIQRIASSLKDCRIVFSLCSENMISKFVCFVLLCNLHLYSQIAILFAWIWLIITVIKFAIKDRMKTVKFSFSPKFYDHTKWLLSNPNNNISALWLKKVILLPTKRSSRSLESNRSGLWYRSRNRWWMSVDTSAYGWHVSAYLALILWPFILSRAV